MDFSSIDIPAVIQHAPWGWLIAVCLGLGLAAATGLRAFLPLLIVAVLARFQVLGLDFGDRFDWLSSNTALIALSVAVVVEVVLDKIPVADSLMDTVMTVARPVLAVVLVMASFSKADPALMPLLALIAGPAALISHGGKALTRPVVTTTTGGLGNPVASVLEDVWSVVLVGLALVAPLLIPLALVLTAWVGWRVFRGLKRRMQAMHAQVRDGLGVFGVKAGALVDAAPSGNEKSDIST